MLSAIQTRIAFHFVPGLGPATYWAFVEHYGSIELAFEQGIDQLIAAADEDTGKPLLKELEAKGEQSRLAILTQQEEDKAAQFGCSLLCEHQAEYPSLLRETKNCPPLLYVKGNVAALSMPQIAVVGSRNPSPVGQALAFEFAQRLVDAGFSITSGLALGIDACAHRGALASEEQGTAKTIAVLGSGVNVLYPKRNRRLGDEILASGGAIVSEYPLDTQAVAQNFPKRNRIVSGLSCGTLVVEAALKSGSLITARLAVQQDREVFAIPGSIRSELARGCNALIKDGAKLVESPMDIVCELESLIQYHGDLLLDAETYGEKDDVAPEQAPLLKAVGFEPTSIDDIVSRIDIPQDIVLEQLLSLELAGHIENTGIGYIRL